MGCLMVEKSGPENFTKGWISKKWEGKERGMTWVSTKIMCLDLCNRKIILVKY